MKILVRTSALKTIANCPWSKSTMPKDIEPLMFFCRSWPGSIVRSYNRSVIICTISEIFADFLQALESTRVPSSKQLAGLYGDGFSGAFEGSWWALAAWFCLRFKNLPAVLTQLSDATTVVAMMQIEAAFSNSSDLRVIALLTRNVSTRVMMDSGPHKSSCSFRLCSCVLANKSVRTIAHGLLFSESLVLCFSTLVLRRAGFVTKTWTTDFLRHRFSLSFVV